MKHCDKSIIAQNLAQRVTIIESFLKRQRNAHEAAQVLQISLSHVYTLAHKAQREGLESLLTLKKRGKPSKKFDEAFKQQIISLYTQYETLCTEQWHIERCTFAQFRTDVLKEKYDITISYAALHKMLKESGKKSPKAHRVKKKESEHTYRDRASKEGKLWLGDGSPFQWFGGTEQQCLHILQDDATGKLVGLRMELNECFFGYAESFKHGLKRNGVPEQVGTDLAAVFYTTEKQKNEVNTDEQLHGISTKKTQMGHILFDVLGIQQCPCYTPQSKGRVERIGQTLQSRLPLIFKMRGICDIDSANAYLPEFMDLFNAEFAVKPESSESAYVALREEDNLTELFSICHTRKTDSAGVFSFHNYKFRVQGAISAVRLRKVKIYLNHEWGIKVKIGKTFYDVELLQLDANKKAAGAERLSIPIVWKDLFDKYLYVNAKTVSNAHLVS